MSDEQTDVVVDAGREWAVHRCGHGCLHVSLDRVMLTLSTDEFQALRDLMNRASHQFESHVTTEPQPALMH